MRQCFVSVFWREGGVLRMGLQEFRGEQENNVQTVQHERSIKKLYLRTPINNTV